MLNNTNLQQGCSGRDSCRLGWTGGAEIAGLKKQRLAEQGCGRGVLGPCVV